ncbi:hypothetical protein M413DRAFT_448016 [Hebeloma cylindrosporum]|uniref:Uncharacterized protein n=1 Tax=Hebeloma cylindrosporum TaxID=76867 RepID=A0A0C3C3X2_HEBCY|nr:hypothetical protein M413DRAFT_448016 [Hebeloma cylindrosporum h7]
MLPATTDDFFFRCLSPVELHRYSQTSKAAHNTVKSYLQRAFQLEHVLGPYFTSPQILEFRRLQFETGTFISGSTALQFFDRTVYPESDLDLYVERRYHAPIALWLESIGYIYCPPEDSTPQSDTFTLAQALSANARHGPQMSINSEYAGPSFIYNFQKSGSSRRIQLILSQSDRPPIEMLLNFHSTCVMNLITHDKAYSLYPRPTFEERRSLVLHSNTAERERALKKYEDRGWTIIKKITKEETQNRRSSFHAGLRYLGDRKCWTLPLSPKLDMAVGQMETHTWGLSYSRGLDVSMVYRIFGSTNLRFCYLVHPLFNTIVHDLARKAKSSDGKMDDALRLLLVTNKRYFV